jgi:site-specific DNA recombinase
MNRERTGRGRRARVEAGKPLAGSSHARYGYRWRDDEKSGMDLDPTTAPVVQRIYSMALDGVPLRRIAITLNDEGVPSPSGRGKWALWALRTMLGDPLYCGLGGGLRWRMEKVRSPRTGNVYRRCVPRPIEEQIPFPPGTVPPIVTVEEYTAVVARLERNKREAARNNRDTSASLLRAGFIRCANCGYGLAYSARHHYYSCATNAASPGRCPARTWINAQTIDDAVWQRVCTVLTDPDIVEREVTRLREADPTTTDLLAIDRQIRDVDRQQRNLIDQLANLGGSVASLVTDKLAALDGNKTRLEEERAEILARQGAWQAAQARIADIRAWCEKVAKNIDRLTYAEKRDALIALDVRVVLHRADHTPRYEITASLPLDVSTTAPVVTTASSK